MKQVLNFIVFLAFLLCLDICMLAIKTAKVYSREAKAEEAKISFPRAYAPFVHDKTGAAVSEKQLVEDSEQAKTKDITKMEYFNNISSYLLLVAAILFIPILLALLKVTRYNFKTIRFSKALMIFYWLLVLFKITLDCIYMCFENNGHWLETSEYIELSLAYLLLISPVIASISFALANRTGDITRRYKSILVAFIVFGSILAFISLIAISNINHPMFSGFGA